MMVASWSKMWSLWKWCVLLLFCVVGCGFTLESGLTSLPFKGLHSIQEVQCSGQSLPAGSNLYAMVLYEGHSDTIMSLADLSKNQCSTADHYTSCLIDSVDPTSSRLSVLVLNLPEGQSRAYGCNASISTSGGRFRVVSWSIVVKHIRLGSNPFPGIPDMQEVSCSGAGLPPGSYPYAMFIYEKRGDRIISSVDIPKRECSTSDFFNACEINDRDYRLTKLRILVPNLHEGETRVFGCNASIKTGRGRFQEVSWFITLRHFSEW